MPPPSLSCRAPYPFVLILHSVLVCYTSLCVFGREATTKKDTRICSTSAASTVLWILLLACAHLPLWADGPQTGTIDGRVLDAQGQGLPGATVTLAGPQGKKTAITGPEGKYRFSLLLDGSFSLSAELEGLGKAEASTVLDAGQRRSVDLSLRAWGPRRRSRLSPRPRWSTSTRRRRRRPSMPRSWRRSRSPHAIPGTTSSCCLAR